MVRDFSCSNSIQQTGDWIKRFDETLFQPQGDPAVCNVLLVDTNSMLACTIVRSLSRRFRTIRLHAIMDEQTTTEIIEESLSRLREQVTSATTPPSSNSYGSSFLRGNSSTSVSSATSSSSNNSNQLRVELVCAVPIGAQLPAALDAAISGDALLQVDLAIFSPRSHGFRTPTQLSQLVTLSIQRAQQVVVPCLEVGNYSESRIDHVTWDAVHNGFKHGAKDILNKVLPSSSSSSSPSPPTSPSSRRTATAPNSDSLARMLSPWRAGVGVDTTDTYLNLLDLDMAVIDDVHAIGALFGVDLREMERREVGSLEQFGLRMKAIGRAHRVVRQPMRLFVVRCPCSEPTRSLTALAHRVAVSSSRASLRGSASAAVNVSARVVPNVTPAASSASTTSTTSATGMNAWTRGRVCWRKCTVENVPLAPPPIGYEQVVEGLASFRRTFELPRPIRLGNLIEIYLDVWESQDGY